MTRKIDRISQYLSDSQLPCPSGAKDVEAIMTALSCVEENKPPVAKYDLSLFKDDTEQDCRRKMVLGTLACVNEMLETGGYDGASVADIILRLAQLRARIDT